MASIPQGYYAIAGKNASGLVNVDCDNLLVNNNLSCNNLTVTGTTSTAETVSNLTVTGTLNTSHSILEDGGGNIVIGGSCTAGSGNKYYCRNPTGVYSGSVSVDGLNIMQIANLVGGSINTNHNTLDDGSGALLASNGLYTGPYNLSTGVGSNVSIRYDAVNNVGIIQATTTGVANRTLQLNPGNGAVTTWRNTLDDGTGLMAQQVSFATTSRNINTPTTVVTAATGITLNHFPCSLIGTRVTVINCDPSVAVAITGSYGPSTVPANTSRTWVLTAANTWYGA
jgi:hypothetical protein